MSWFRKQPWCSVSRQLIGISESWNICNASRITNFLRHFWTDWGWYTFANRSEFSSFSNVGSKLVENKNENIHEFETCFLLFYSSNVYNRRLKNRKWVIRARRKGTDTRAYLLARACLSLLALLPSCMFSFLWILRIVYNPKI